MIIEMLIIVSKKSDEKYVNKENISISIRQIKVKLKSSKQLKKHSLFSNI